MDTRKKRKIGTESASLETQEEWGENSQVWEKRNKSYTFECFRKEGKCENVCN